MVSAIFAAHFVFKEWVVIRSPFKRYGIRPVFFVSFSSFIILLLVSVIYVSYLISVDQMIKNTSYYQQIILDNLNKRLETQLSTVEDISVVVSKNSNMKTYFSFETNSDYLHYRYASDMESDLSTIVYSTPIIHSMDVYMDNPPPSDPQRPIHFDSLTNAKQENWYSKVSSSDFVWIGQHEVSTYQGNVNVISLARKIFSANNKLQAVVLINVKTSDIQAIIQGVNDGGANRFILDAGERTITLIGDPQIVKTGRDQLLSIDGFDRNSGMYVNQNGFMTQKNALMVWSRMFNTDWILIQVTPMVDMLKGSMMIAGTLSGIGFVAILIVLFLTLFLSRKFTKPMSLLVEAMNRFPDVKMQNQLPTDYENEFGVLFQGYQNFRNRIRELYASLEEQYARQRAAEIKALQSMINPHFLYNTLDQLNWMAIEANQEQISEVLELLGRMYRIGLSNGESLIRVQEELYCLNCYIKIQQIRLGHDFAFSFDVQNELRDHYMPKMTLQPFVENAVLHGFHGRESGEIKISMTQMHDHLVILIRDNGVGIQADWEKAKHRETGGYGIRNVVERIDAFFGSPYGVSITSLTGQGTEVAVRLPILENKDSFGGMKNGSSRDCG